MIYAVLGPTSPSFMLVARLTHFLMEAAYGSVLIYDINTAEQLKTYLADRNGAPCLICSDCPEDIITELIIRTGLPAIIISEPFQELHAFSVCQFALDFYSAAREVSRKLSSMHSLAGISNVATIKFSEEGKLLWLLSRIASSLDIPVTEVQLQAALDMYCDPIDTEKSIMGALRRISDIMGRMRDCIQNYTAEENVIIHRLSMYYDPLIADARVEVIKWPVETLINAENGSPISSPIDLLGPARLISYGPYLYLPKGWWIITLTFTVRENYSGNRLVVDIYTPLLNKILVAAKGEIPLQGSFSTSIDFEVESSLHPLEIRLYSQVGAIEGIIEIVDISLRKRGEGN